MCRPWHTCRSQDNFGGSSLLPHYGSQGLNSDLEVWLQTPLPAVTSMSLAQPYSMRQDLVPAQFARASGLCLSLPLQNCMARTDQHSGLFSLSLLSVGSGNQTQILILALQTLTEPSRPPYSLNQNPFPSSAAPHSVCSHCVPVAC